jgi:Tol biopolymer transport system component
MRLVAVATLCGVSAFLCPIPPVANNGPESVAGPHPCSLRVVNTRAARTNEIPYEQKHLLLRDLEDGRVAPGPSTLRAVVKSDKQHHPFVHIEDTASGTSRLLLSQTLSRPRWSPDGRKVACTTFKSSARPWMLCVVDVESGRKVEPEFGALVSKFRWSPDSKSIAVSGILYGRPACVLVWVSVPSGQARILDTLNVHTDYEFSWSPDSRLLAVSRPTALNTYEEVTSAELWLLDHLGRKCRLTSTNDPETAPAWIDSSRLSFERASWHRGEPDASSRMVLEFDRAAFPGR